MASTTTSSIRPLFYLLFLSLQYSLLPFTFSILREDRCLVVECHRPSSTTPGTRGPAAFVRVERSSSGMSLVTSSSHTQLSATPSIPAIKIAMQTLDLNPRKPHMHGDWDRDYLEDHEKKNISTGSIRTIALLAMSSGMSSPQQNISPR